MEHFDFRAAENELDRLENIQKDPGHPDHAVARERQKRIIDQGNMHIRRAFFWDLFKRTWKK